MRLIIALLVCVLLSMTRIGGADDGHRQAAEAFYRVASLDDPKTVSVMVAQLVIGLQPGLRRHQDVVRLFAEEMLASRAFVDVRVQVYMDLFSEQQLHALTKLFEEPVYRTYRAKRIELVSRSASAILEVFADALPELDKRIRSAEDDSTKN